MIYLRMRTLSHKTTVIVSPTTLPIIYCSIIDWHSLIRSLHYVRALDSLLNHNFRLKAKLQRADYRLQRAKTAHQKVRSRVKPEQTVLPDDANFAQPSWAVVSHGSESNFTKGLLSCGAYGPQVFKTEKVSKEDKRWNWN